VDATDIPLAAGQSVGQTLTSPQAGLFAVEIFLAPDGPGNGTLTLHLRSSPLSTTDLTHASLPAAAVTQPGFYSISFQPQADSYLKDYYLLLEITGPAKLKTGSAAGNTYLDGALYRNGSPVDAQLAFRPVYGNKLLAAGLLKQSITWLWQLLLAVGLFVIPGWALLSWLWAGWRRLSWGEKAGLGAGVSLALYPMLMLWTDLFHVHLGAGYAWLPMLAGVAYLAASRARGWLKRKNGQGTPGKTFSIQAIHPTAFFPNLALMIVIGILVGLRLWVVRTLQAPMWGDAYQHTMIAQLIIDHGGLFSSWLPYVPYNSLTVQYGFSANAAVFSWLSHIPSPQTALLTGQFIDCIAILSLYPLAVRLSRGKHWAGIAAVVAGGLLSSMPAFYVNWGRYAQLAGQAILPACIWLAWDYLDDTKSEDVNNPITKFLNQLDWKKTLVIGLTLAGMLLAYYRMAFYFATFFLAWILGWALPRWGFKVNAWLSGLIKTVGAAVVSALFLMPWLAKVSGSSLASSVESGISNASPLNGVLQDYAAWRNVTGYLPAYLLALGLIALGWGLLRKDWIIPAMGIWVLALAGVKAGALIKMPGANMMGSFAVLIALYIPASLLAGWFFAQIVEVIPAGNKSAQLQAAAAVAILAAAGYGAYQHKDLSNPGVFALVNRPDLRAMQWIQANTSPASRFLVEGFSIYNGTSVVGADAGWWISMLGKRQNTMPPQYALLNETPDPIDYSQKVTALVNTLEKQGLGQVDTLALLCKEGISHVYIGQGQGMIGAGARQLFSAQELSASYAFDLVYRQDRVWIFALKPSACGK
jgi:hypothetical protein